MPTTMMMGMGLGDGEQSSEETNVDMGQCTTRQGLLPNE